jgi:hypothetical protein
LVNHVIEQYTIATTPKYNFPQPTIDTTLPQRFTEQSLSSLRYVHNPPFQLNQQGLQESANVETHTQILQLRMQPVVLKKSNEETMIAGCDTSTMKIGETSTGMLIAVRGANVWKKRKSYKYTRYGPFIFHITEENQKEVYNTLDRACFVSACRQNHLGFANLLQNPTRIASLLERWLQNMLSRTMNGGLVLFDGSLTAGTTDTSTERLKWILSTARNCRNVVLAFSKVTSLRINGRLITDVSLQQRAPYLLETTGLRPKPPTVLLGEVYVARLFQGNYSFRLDIDKENPFEQRVEAVEKLVGNDVLRQGYPETLRLAHILCTFTANEVIAMQHFVARRCGLRIIERPDMHRLLFGPFGGGESCS